MADPDSGQLFEISVVGLDPPSLATKSADCDFFGTASDGMSYAIKTINGKNPKAPASELFCYEIASKCGIAVPPYAVLRMKDKTQAFGSRWEGGVNQDTAVITQIISGALPSVLLPERLSAIYAFDYFVGNGDRHPNNYLFQKSLKDKYVVLAFDFSRAWTFHDWPLPNALFTPLQQTVVFYKIIQTHQPFEEKSAHAVLRALLAIPVSFIRDVVHNKMPASWLDKNKKNAIVKWWSSKELKARIDFLKKGISDGTLL
jgi:hypothetical protein